MQDGPRAQGETHGAAAQEADSIHVVGDLQLQELYPYGITYVGKQADAWLGIHQSRQLAKFW